MSDLFDSIETERRTEALADGAVILRGFALEVASELLAQIEAISAQSPFRHLVVPGGKRMSVAMTNCGPLGWVSDTRGYRYEAIDPLTQQAWPALPRVFVELAQGAAQAAGYHDKLSTDACLVNRYEPGSRLTLHQDRDERDVQAPIISVSLGVPAIFVFGRNTRSGPTKRSRLVHGDVVVWGGVSRLAYHGVQPIAEAQHPATGSLRYNLTFRKVF
jgi:alkylated DNA repair protein (DNA oxidative demethylase)